MPRRVKFFFTVFCACLPSVAAPGQTTSGLAALKGLSPVSTLEFTAAGRMALKANYRTTGGIQTGSIKQPTLLPWPEQQEQALRDAFITWGNATQLADGLGGTLGKIYQSLTKCIDIGDPLNADCPNVTPMLQAVIAYASETSGADAAAAKYFFANETTDGKLPASDEARAVLSSLHARPDPFGRAYGWTAGSAGANPFGNSRPFQTEPSLISISGLNYFGKPAENHMYLEGPMEDLRNNPSFPSGHTTYAYTQALLLAIMVPDRYPQMVARAAEYSNNRIVIGAHYAMDVVAGRTLALYDMAQLLANKPGYAGRTEGDFHINDFPTALAEAATELRRRLVDLCGHPVAVCAAADDGRFADAVQTRDLYEATMDYALGKVYGLSAGVEDVGTLAPEAGYLLTTAFPYLSLTEADAILTSTEGPGGGFLDNGSRFGIYSRLDLYKASIEALSRRPKR
jgi:hypothetical protein